MRLNVVEVELGVEVWLGVGRGWAYYFGWVGVWGGLGRLKKSDIKLISTQVVVEVRVELGNIPPAH